MSCLQKWDAQGTLDCHVLSEDVQRQTKNKNTCPCYIQNTKNNSLTSVNCPSRVLDTCELSDVQMLSNKPCLIQKPPERGEIVNIITPKHEEMSGKFTGRVEISGEMYSTIDNSKIGKLQNYNCLMYNGRGIEECTDDAWRFPHLYDPCCNGTVSINDTDTVRLLHDTCPHAPWLQLCSRCD
jgi:hypothetical protein